MPYVIFKKKFALQLKSVRVFIISLFNLSSHIYNIAHNFKDHKENPIFTDACTIMEIKFSKYRKKLPYLFALAAVMDPKIKFSGVNFLLPLLMNY